MLVLGYLFLTGNFHVLPFGMHQKFAFGAARWLSHLSVQLLIFGPGHDPGLMGSRPT